MHALGRYFANKVTPFKFKYMDLSVTGGKTIFSREPGEESWDH